MLNPLRTTLYSLIFFLSFAWYMLYYLSIPKTSKYKTYKIFLPTEDQKRYQFSSYYLYDCIKQKKEIRINLDEDREADRKSVV